MAAAAEAALFVVPAEDPDQFESSFDRDQLDLALKKSKEAYERQKLIEQRLDREQIEQIENKRAPGSRRPIVIDGNNVGFAHALQVRWTFFCHTLI